MVEGSGFQGPVGVLRLGAGKRSLRKAYSAYMSGCGLHHFRFRVLSCG